MGVDEELLREIARRILSLAKPDRIILLGSAAAGRMTRHSDIDLLILEPSPGNTRRESLLLRRALHGLGFPVDVVVMATPRLDESKNVIGGIAYPAHKYGRVIYEAA